MYHPSFRMPSPEAFTFSRVPIPDARKAFAFHRRISDRDSYIWPRTEVDIRRYSEEGFLFQARRDSTGEIVGLCYSMLEDECWEVGGLAVHASVRGRGIGAVLVRFALVHTLALQQPWADANRQRVIAHVHEENDSPRRILEAAGFEVVRSIEVPGAQAPAGMKLNAAGNLPGDELEFRANGLRKLSAWLDASVDGGLLRNASATLEFGIYAVADLRTALTDMVAAGVSSP